MFIVNALPTEVLVDAGATHSFINPTTIARMACVLKELDVQLCVITPAGSMYQADQVEPNCTVTLQNRLFVADLTLLGIHGYDVILGMDWLTKYRATIDCKWKTITLVTLEGENIVHKGNHSSPPIPVNSATKGYKLIGKGCTVYLCAVEAGETPKLELKDVPIVQEFPEVFQEVPELPPDRELEFAIELIPGTTPISKAPYRMALVELTELKKHLHELLEK